MCECGCSSGLPAYKLPIDENSYYGVELYDGCKDCTTSPAIIVRRVRKGESLDIFFKEAPVLSVKTQNDEVVIKCGLDPDEHRKAVVKALAGTDVEGGEIDEWVAEEIADDLWEPRMPEVIEHKEKRRG